MTYADTVFTLYILLLVVTAWVSTYMRHLRETAAVVEEKLTPLLPSGTRFHVPVPWYIHYGVLENAAILGTLAFAMTTLLPGWTLAGFAFFLFVLLPISSRFLAPRAGSWHFMKRIRKLMQSRLQEHETNGDRARAELMRMSLDRLDKGL